MKLTLQVVIQQGDELLRVQEIACIERDTLSPETLGLSLQEAKAVLAQLQETLVTEQVVAAVAEHQICPHCGVAQRRKGQHQIVVRSLFGRLTLASPRLYTCACQRDEPRRSHSPLAQLLPERTTPELQYLQAKWAALLPYGVTVDVLEEVLPMETNHTSVYRQLQQVAERLEAELGDEQAFFVEGCQRDWNALPRPDGPFTVGIDGGYVHARDGDNRKAGWFEVIVGKSIPTDSEDKCFGFVTDYDTKPKRRLAELLKTQGLQMNQAITFLSDGGDNVRDLQFYLSPIAEHVLDWFHVTMRITVLCQQLKELLTRAPHDDLVKLDVRFESIKWYLWHGNTFRALEETQGVQFELEGYEEEVSARTKLAKSVREFYGYIEANEHFIPNYGERYRYGEAIATGFVESTVNQVISKRMVKKQQMRWTKKGAHLLLQVRTQELNKDLHKTFERWYPAMAKTDVPLQKAA
jgi:hypothetical protein